MTETMVLVRFERGIDRHLAIVFGAQVALLVAIAAISGLGPGGWIVGVGYAIAAWMVMDYATKRARMTSFGPADLVTLTRTVLIGGIAAITADSLGTGNAPIALIVMAVIALVLDGVDGKVARRMDAVSKFGARFDMEADSFLILVLSILTLPMLGPIVLLSGTMRYQFALAAVLLPWLRCSTPSRYSAKVVAALQGIVLVVVASEVLSRSSATVLMVVSAATVIWSFGCTVQWLRSHRAQCDYA